MKKKRTLWEQSVKLRSPMTHIPPPPLNNFVTPSIIEMLIVLISISAAKNVAIQF